MKSQNQFQQVIDRWRQYSETVPRIHLDGPSSNVMFIDCGHGGLNSRDEYVTAPSKMTEHPDFTFYEGVWNRAVGWTLAREFYSNKRNYIMVAGDINDVDLTERILIASSWTNELRKRGKKFYLSSIHGNAFGQASVNGVEVFTSPGQTFSDPIATIQYYKLSKLGWRMRNATGDGDPDKEARFSMLVGPEKFDIPATLPEIGFYTNPQQALEMCQVRTINKIAFLLYSADIQVERLDLLP